MFRSLSTIMTSQYRKFLRLIEKWPLDHSKKDRDLGKFIRDRVKIAFESKDKSVLNTELCNRQYAALNRLADNTHLKHYKIEKVSSASGLTPEECNLALSSEFLEYLKEENQGFLSKLFRKK